MGAYYYQEFKEGLINAYTGDKFWMVLLCAAVFLLILLTIIRGEYPREHRFSKVLAEVAVVILGIVIVPALLGIVTDRTNEFLEEQDLRRIQYDQAQKYYDNGNYINAVNILRELIGETENNNDYEYELARNLIKLEEYEEAEDILVRLIEEEPENSEIFSCFGNLLYSLERYNEAYTYHSKAYALDNDIDTYYEDMGYDLYELGRYEEAAYILGDLYLDEKLSINDYLTYVKCLEGIQQYEEALKVVTKGMHKNPSNYDRFEIYSAIEKLNIELTQNPNDSNKISDLGYKYSSVGEYEKSFDCFKLASDIEPLSAWHYKNAAYELYYLQKYDEAINFMQKALAITPDNERYKIFLKLNQLEYNSQNNGEEKKDDRVERIICRIRLGFDESGGIYEFEELYPTDEMIEKLWRFNESQQKYRNESDNYTSCLSYCYSLIELDLEDEAEQIISTQLEKYPNYDEYHNIMGMINSKKGLYEEAEKEFKLAIKYADKSRLDKYQERLEKIRELLAEDNT